MYVTVRSGLKKWGFQTFLKPKHSNGPIICNCSHFTSSSSAAVTHKPLLSLLHNAAPQEAFFARIPWLRSCFQHPLVFLQTLLWRNGTREETVTRDETKFLISSFVSFVFFDVTKKSKEKHLSHHWAAQSNVAVMLLKFTVS